MLSDLLYRLRALIRRESMETELDEELRDHLERQAEKYQQSGLPPEEAMRHARIDFGGPEQIRQQTRDGRGTRLLEDLMQDARYAVRTLAKSPAFTAIAIFTLALGIGASTAIFSLIHAVLLRSLPYGDSARLVYLYTPNPRYNLPAEIFGPSNADFFDLKRQSQSFSDITHFDQPTFSPNTTASDIQPGHDRVLLISHALWQSAFNQRADILTQSVLLDAKSYRIIGVMPPAFQYPHASDLPYGNSSIHDTQIWVPFALTPQQVADRESSTGNAVARLKPGATIASAQAETSALMSHLDRLRTPDARGYG